MIKSAPAIAWPPLIKGTLVKRYKRFLADVRLPGGQTVTAHTPNTGRMLLCSEPGRPVYLSRSSNLKRKLAYTWEMIDMEDGLVGVNTTLPNRLAAMAAGESFFPGWPQKPEVRTEVKAGLSRLDLQLLKDGQVTWVEVKNCTLVQDGVALFPDAVSARGAKHLIELREKVKSGDRAILLVMIQRRGAHVFSPAHKIDPRWAETLKEVLDNGVELEAREVILDLNCATLGARIKSAV
ncbi:MAG: DNA/RNA nuclease SfsA [Deltaproteobacteria bacterium]|nr:DNA/RNA nuclease SfsA [Deltaproteobacteria bacterium]